MNRALTIGVIVSAAPLLIATLSGQSQYHKEIPLSDESVVYVRLESAYGVVNITGSEENLLLNANMIVEPSIDVRTDVNYRKDDGRGFLNLTLRPVDRQKRGWAIRNVDLGTWDLAFTKAVPMNFQIELGAGRGRFDFSGMHVNRLDLSAGASSVVVRFDEPNTGFIDVLQIKSGVSRFTGENLGNANFGTLNFEGGIGSYTLNFDGNLRHEAHVHVTLGIGAVSLIIPEHIGVKLHTKQRLFSSVDIPDDFERINGDQYVSANFETAEGRLVINIESGFGSVRVQR